jgi:hypothetical protein
MLMFKGYYCTFFKRSGEDKSDGCSICFKKDKFKLIKELPVTFFKPGVQVLDRYIELHSSIIIITISIVSIILMFV